RCRAPTGRMTTAPVTPASSSAARTAGSSSGRTSGRIMYIGTPSAPRSRSACASTSSAARRDASPCTMTIAATLDPSTSSDSASGDCHDDTKGLDDAHEQISAASERRRARRKQTTLRASRRVAFRSAMLSASSTCEERLELAAQLANDLFDVVRHRRYRLDAVDLRFEPPVAASSDLRERVPGGLGQPLDQRSHVGEVTVPLRQPRQRDPRRILV